MNVHVPAVIVNVVGRGTCARCRKVGAAEARELAALRRSIARGRAGRPRILVAPAMMPDGAVHIDTTPYTLEEVVDQVVKLVLEESGSQP